MKKLSILVEVADQERVAAAEILGADFPADVQEEDHDEWRIGESVVAWFAVVAAVSGAVQAVVAVAEWVRKKGGKGEVEIRELRVTSTQTDVVTIAKWNANGSLEELTDVVSKASNDISIKVS